MTERIKGFIMGGTLMWVLCNIEASLGHTLGAALLMTGIAMLAGVLLAYRDRLNRLEKKDAETKTSQG